MSAGVPILVVDDEPPIRRLLRTSLGAQGFQVVEASDAETALALIAAERPEVVLLDLGLPDIDGMEVIRRLRAAGDKTPIIVLSSRGDERGKVEALDLGADDYVTKPFGMAELVARIRTALRHRVQEQGAEPIFKQRRSYRRSDAPPRYRGGGEEVKLSPEGIRHPAPARHPCGKGADPPHDHAGSLGREPATCNISASTSASSAHKLEGDPGRPALILTETGVGYRLAEGE